MCYGTSCNKLLFEVRKYSRFRLPVISVRKVVRRSCATHFELARRAVLEGQDECQQQNEPFENPTNDRGEDEQIGVILQDVQQHWLAALLHCIAHRTERRGPRQRVAQLLRIMATLGWNDRVVALEVIRAVDSATGQLKKEGPRIIKRSSTRDN